jgi:acetyl-CoA synthetase
MAGYYDDPERTKDSYVELGGRRWFRTGDLVDVNADYYVTYDGRTDDIINSSGYRIGPQEVENVLMTHEAVLEAAVVGMPDADRGEIVAAFVVLSPAGRTLHDRGESELVAELQSHARSVSAPYKYPRRIEFVDDLPKTPTGKIRRAVLRSSFNTP